MANNMGADGEKSITILGATGSIGASTLDLISAHPNKFKASVLTGGKNVESLVELAKHFRPDLVVIADEDHYAQLALALSGLGIEVAAGADALVDAASRPADLVVSAITGIAGLMPTLSAVRAGQTVAIANKESLVTAGDIITRTAKEHGATILPIDSEHNAVFQAWVSPNADDIRDITLTASGGPFWGRSLAEMEDITPAQAIKHPNWSMGAKVSIDSATMMNKGLEVIEAAVLFDLPEDRVKVLVHPSSVVHGMVQYHDGTLLAQLGPADMRVPISYALAWPERLNWNANSIDLADIANLEFFAPNNEVFPCLELAREASRNGGYAPTVLNAANEMAVEFFLHKKIGFLDIARLNRHMMDKLAPSGEVTLDQIFEVDHETRQACLTWQKDV